MVEHLLNPESKNESTASSQSTSALSALDLLREGSVLNGKSSQDSGNKHLRPVDIVGVEPKPADAKVEPAKPFPGAVPARISEKLHGYFLRDEIITSWNGFTSGSEWLSEARLQPSILHCSYG